MGNQDLHPNTHRGGRIQLNNYGSGRGVWYSPERSGITGRGGMESPTVPLAAASGVILKRLPSERSERSGVSHRTAGRGFQGGCGGCVLPGTCPLGRMV